MLDSQVNSQSYRCKGLGSHSRIPLKAGVLACHAEKATVLHMKNHWNLIAGVLLILGLVWPTHHSAAQRIPEYDLHVSFDVSSSKILGLAKITALEGTPILFNIGGLKIVSVDVNGQPIRHDTNDGRLRILPTVSGTLEIRYEGLFKPSSLPPSSRDPNIPSVISPAGIFLTSAWYPQMAALAIYRLTAVLPQGYTAVSEAERIERSEDNGRIVFTFDFKHPVDGINLVASDRYQVIEERFQGIDLSAYFFAEDQALARKYLDYTKKYIQLYERLLLPFPFTRFAIVENFLPTGYSMPTYTLLGQEVVRLPFIVETSLGHEILHQWFGNQVYVNPKEGNWAEGLTTYLADHFYAQEKGEGGRYRKQILIDYMSYVHTDNEFPLKNFAQRFSDGSRAIGYGKAALVFHMLRHMYTGDAFFKALREFVNHNQFQRASWNDIKSAFENQLGEKLDWFFNQWIEHLGLPELRVSNLAVNRDQSVYFLAFDLSQKGAVYRLDVPVTVSFKSGGTIKEWIRIDEEKKPVRIELKEDPAKLIIDPDYDIARKLSDSETPPVIATILGDDKLIVVPPLQNTPDYDSLVQSLRSRGAQVRSADSLTHADVKMASLLLLGDNNPILDHFPVGTKRSEHGFSITVKKNPFNAGKAVGLVVALSAEETKAAFPKIFHYGKYSALEFDQGVNVHKAIADTDRGIQINLKKDPAAIDMATVDTLSDVIEKVASKKIVYVGESHTNFAHHEVQLQVLKGLHRQNSKIAIGMEMFQRSSQKALDDYVNGEIDERTFLKRSEYFKRWGMDYNLYKPILDYARNYNIPVIALNLPREIIDKVGKSGLDSLAEDEKRAIPQDLDLSDEAYKARLKEVFAAHSNSTEKTFDFFYQAQILWDEAMAESVDGFLSKHPDHRIIVFAGSGHLEYGHGIPKRAHRRNRLDYAVVLSDAQFEKGIADFIVFPDRATPPVAPKLMVYLKTEDGKLQITGFVDDSVSEKAGLKVEDLLLTLDGHEVESIEDVKIALFFKHPGDTINVKIRRPAFFTSDEDMEFPVKLQSVFP